MLDAYQAFASCYDSLMYDVDYDEWAKYLVELIKKHNSTAKTIADIACGTGSISIRFNKAGYSVVGVDLSNAMLDVAAQKARKIGAKISFVCQDMKNLKLHRQVDVVNCAMDGVNYLTSADEMKRFFESANKLLKPSGIFMFDVSTEYKLGTIIGEDTFCDEVDNAAFIWASVFDSETLLSTMHLTLFVKTDNNFYNRFEEQHIQRAHSLFEIESCLLSTGFEVIGVYSFLGNDNAREDDERWQIVAKKV